MMQIYTLELSTETLPAPVFQELADKLSNEKTEEIKKMRLDIDKKLRLYADLLVRIEAARILTAANNDVVFGKNQFGKPFLCAYPDFQFNISHTHYAIAAAFSNKPIGIDIEKICTPHMEIARRFFTANEYTYINSGPDMAVRFFEIWTKKEAYIKYDGRGLSLPLNSFDVFQHSDHYYVSAFSEYIYAVYHEECNEQISICTIEEDLFLKMAYAL